MKVICLDASGKPSDISDSKWLKQNQIYTIVSVEFMHQQGIYGCTLEEIEGEFPYTHFACSRFRELTPHELVELELSTQLETI